MPSTLLALLLLSQCRADDGRECLIVTGLAVPREPYYVLEVLRDNGDVDSLYWGAELRHQSSGEVETIDIGDTRRVRYCRVHAPDRLSPVLITEGMSSQDYRMAVVMADWVNEVEPTRRSADDVLVERGLGHESWPTRCAASRILAGRGERSIRALRRGLRSRDAEVRERSRVALLEIEGGPLE